MRCFIFIIFLSGLISCHQKTTVPIYTEQAGNIPRLYIPVSIAGKSCLFIFDTGTSKTMIKTSITKKLGLYSNSDSGVVDVFSSKQRNRKFYLSENIPIKIGEFKIETRCYLENDNHLEKEQYDGILGYDVMSHFSWLFDFEKRQVLISNKPAKIINRENYNQHLRLVYYTYKGKIPVVPFFLNDSVRLNMVFDTGSHGLDIKIGNETLYSDFFFTFSNKKHPVYDYIKHRCAESISFYGYNSFDTIYQGTYHRSQKIDNYVAYNVFYKSDLNPYYEEDTKNNINGLICLPFAKRFRLMHINTFNQCIELYVSTRDTSVYKGINELYKRLEHFKNK